MNERIIAYFVLVEARGRLRRMTQWRGLGRRSLPKICFILVLVASKAGYQHQNKGYWRAYSPPNLPIAGDRVSPDAWLSEFGIRRGSGGWPGALSRLSRAPTALFISDPANRHTKSSTWRVHPLDTTQGCKIRYGLPITIKGDQ